MPNFCEEFETADEAVEALAQINDLTEAEKAELSKEFFLRLDLKRHGNDYAEIVEC